MVVTGTDLGDAPNVLSLLGLSDTLMLIQRLAGRECTLWVATQGAVAATDVETVDDADGHALWGLGRSAALEFPRLWGGLIDLPAQPSAEALAGVLTGATGEDQVVIRDSVLGRRLRRAPAATDSWRPQGTVLVTGGTGALGAHVARWAARNGVSHLVLTSRRGADAPGATELVAELTELGADVTVAACDVTDREALAALLTDQPPTAVVHTAGVGGLGRLPELTQDDLADTLAGKVTGAVNLDALCPDVEAFVLFGSAAATWGGANQGAYAAANAHLDALARQRRSRGLPATSIAWGAWAGDGMAGGAHDALARRGILVMDPDLALSVMAEAVAEQTPTITVAGVDWDRFAPAFTAARPSPLLADLVRTVETEPADAGKFREDLLARPAHEREDVLFELVRSQAALVLGHARAEEVEPDRAFRDLGFDSLTAVEMRNRLNAVTGLPLLATVVFDYPTPTDLAAHLLAECGLDQHEPDGEAALQAALAAIPLSRLREAGLLDPLRRLVGLAPEPAESTELDDLDGEDLLKLVATIDGEN